MEEHYIGIIAANYLLLEVMLWTTGIDRIG